MSRTLFVFLFLAGIARAAMAHEPDKGTSSASGTARCISSDDGLCRIVADFPTGSVSSYWIEEMDPETSLWRRASDLGPSLAGPGAVPLAGGQLYRVVGCDDVSDTQTCISSTVVWAPFQPMSVDAIPEVVDNKRGVKMYVGKKLSRRAQKQVYNVYLRQRLMNGMSDDAMKSMPPMTRTRFPLDISNERLVAEATEDEIIHHVLFMQYEVRRTGQSLLSADGKLLSPYGH